MEICIKIPTTDYQLHWALFMEAQESKEVYKISRREWRYEGGDVLYWIDLYFLVDSKAPYILLERFIRIKLRVESYPTKLKKYSREPEEFIDFTTIRIDYKTLDIKA
jgi:hypothetical protein